MVRTPTHESVTVSEVIANLPISAEATTSRVVVDTPAIRVVVFAMDAGQELTDHSAPRAVVVQVLSGLVDFSYGGSRSQLGAGDVVYLAPGERHAVVATAPCHFALTLVDLAPAASSP